MYLTIAKNTIAVNMGENIKKSKSNMDPNFILALIVAAASGLWAVPKLMVSANDRVVARDKVLDDRFNQIWNRLEAGEKDMLLIRGVIESNQSATSHRIEMQEQRIGLNLESIMTQMKTLSKQLDDIQHQLSIKS